MVKLEWGNKRTCQSCSTRFYDLLKSPIMCPKCNNVFEVQTTGRGRRSRATTEAAKEVGIRIEDIELVDDIALGDDIAVSQEDDIIEDTDDLDEGLNDLPDVMEDTEE